MRAISSLQPIVGEDRALVLRPVSIAHLLHLQSGMLPQLIERNREGLSRLTDFPGQFVGGRLDDFDFALSRFAVDRRHFSDRAREPFR